MIIIIIMNLSQETTVFGGRQKLTSAMNARQKSDSSLQIQVSLHRESPEVGLVEKLTGSLYWWVEQYVPRLHLSDDEEPQEFPVFVGLHKWTSNA